MHAGLLARDLGLDQRQRDVLVCATLLRAVGYLPLPERPRLNPGPLAPDERALVELHPRLGFDILARAPALQDVATAVLYHHERFDGTGYPAGLAGTDIPLPARVLAVLEAYGAMTHERPYRTPWPDEQACQELVAGAATQFDPEIAARFVEQVRRAPRVTHEDVAAAVVEALPLEPLGAGLDGTFVAAAVDGPTLLGNHRALQHDIAASARHGTPFGLVLVELSELAHINAASGFASGDQVIEQAARSTRRAAARLGGTAYRLSGRRLAIIVPARDGHVPPNTLDEVHAEFLAGPAMHATMAAWSPGEEGDAVLNRARDALRDNAA
jgi:GGDEF domain-containing protein